MRVKPIAVIGVGVWLVYLVIVVVLQKASGIPYTDFGSTTGNMWRGVIPSLVIGSLVIAGVAVWFGWWSAAMRDRHRTRIGWTLIAPGVFLVIALSNFAFTDWGSVSPGFLLVALVMGVFVGFAEELVCRGILLVGLRGTFHEVAAWALTCLLFGVMHGLNIFLGAAAGPTLLQVVAAAMQGSAFYVLRRYFGVLAWAMVLHGLWDMSIEVHAVSGAPVNVVALLVWPVSILALVAGFVVARRTARGPLEDYAVGEEQPAAAAA